jgi:hypothetical protein
MNRNKPDIQKFEDELIELCKKYNIVISEYYDPCYCECDNCECSHPSFHFNTKGNKSTFGLSIYELKYQLESKK